MILKFYALKEAKNPSDFLSRHSNLKQHDKQETQAKEYVNFLAWASVSKVMTLAEIQKAIAQDITMHFLANLIHIQSWRNIDKLPQQFQDADCTELKHFKHVQHKMSSLLPDPWHRVRMDIEVHFLRESTYLL